ncbi:ABC transporter ATP-binding protein [Streptacidiphilus sp. EB129]|uniref:ABC transporter ATP-binding protein n=1 Tax=Streptacidiphilus sp. EB129 TaxID=3156262 RepID=UPI003510FE1A
MRKTGRNRARVGPTGWALLWGQLRLRKRPLVLMTAWTAAEALPAALSGRLIAQALDAGFLAGHVAAGIGWLLALGAATVVGAWGQRQVYPHLADVVEPLRDALTRRVVTATLSAPQYALAPDTTAVSRLTRQIETVRDCVAGQLLVIRHFAITAVFVILGAASLGTAFLPLIGIPLGAALLLFVLLMPLLATRQYALLAAEEEFAHLATENLTALRDVIACGAADRSGTVLDDSVSTQTRARYALAGIGTLRRLAVGVGAHLPAALIVIDAARLVRHGLPPGAVVGALAYLTLSLEPALRTLVQGIGASGLRLTVALDRLARTTSQAPAEQPPERPPAVGARSPQGSGVDLDHVTFAYHPQAEPVVDALTLCLADGEHLALVGPSGTGKSTVANLVAALTTPTGGAVRLGGVPLDTLPPRELATLRTLIPQQAYVFDGTVRDNLGYLRSDATDHAMGRAAELLGLAPLLHRLGGLGAHLDTRALSSGEKQLITLVRAYLSPAALVILDEATSHLAPAAEARIEEAFRARPGTLIVIAHRISSAQRADRVLLMDGPGTATGTHRELLANSPTYRELVGHWTGEPG